MRTNITIGVVAVGFLVAAGCSVPASVEGENVGVVQQGITTCAQSAWCCACEQGCWDAGWDKGVCRDDGTCFCKNEMPRPSTSGRDCFWNISNYSYHCIPAY